MVSLNAITETPYDCEGIRGITKLNIFDSGSAESITSTVGTRIALTVEKHSNQKSLLLYEASSKVNLK